MNEQWESDQIMQTIRDEMSQALANAKMAAYANGNVCGYKDGYEKGVISQKRDELRFLSEAICSTANMIDPIAWRIKKLQKEIGNE